MLHRSPDLWQKTIDGNGFLDTAKDFFGFLLFDLVGFLLQLLDLLLDFNKSFFAMRLHLVQESRIMSEAAINSCLRMNT